MRETPQARQEVRYRIKAKPMEAWDLNRRPTGIRRCVLVLWLVSVFGFGDDRRPTSDGATSDE